MASLSEPINVAWTPDPQPRRADWIRRATALVDQIVQWSLDAGWRVERTEVDIEENPLGAYTLPAARVYLPVQPGWPERALVVTPIALYITGGDGRVDLEGYPTLSRVKLLGISDGWQIMTDSNVPLRLPWEQSTFRQLAEDLVA